MRHCENHFFSFIFIQQFFTQKTWRILHTKIRGKLFACSTRAHHSSLPSPLTSYSSHVPQKTDATASVHQLTWRVICQVEKYIISARLATAQMVASIRLIIKTSHCAGYSDPKDVDYHLYTCSIFYDDSGTTIELIDIGMDYFWCCICSQYNTSSCMYYTGHDFTPLKSTLRILIN